MTSIQPFQLTDLYHISNVNLDSLTENFNVGFYSQYLIQWSELFIKSAEHDDISGYLMGKVEGSGTLFHAHITAVTVDFKYRRIALASYLCEIFKIISHLQKVYFIDLFVKVNNELGKRLYEKLGYSVFRRVVGYYGSSSISTSNMKNSLNDNDDAFDMRFSFYGDKNLNKNGERSLVLPHQVVF